MYFPLGDGGRSAQRVLFVVRRGTTWSFRVTWSFSRWDVDAVARQHAIARAKGTDLSSAFISRRKKVHMTRNDHVVPRRTTNKTLCALRPPSPSGKSIPPPLMTDISKISLRKKKREEKSSSLGFEPTTTVKSQLHILINFDSKTSRNEPILFVTHLI